MTNPSDLIAFAKTGEIGPKAECPVLTGNPFAHLEIVTRPDGATLVINRETDVARAFKKREQRNG